MQRLFYESVRKYCIYQKNIDYANMTCLRVVLLPIDCLLVKNVFRNVLNRIYIESMLLECIINSFKQKPAYADPGGRENCCNFL